MQTLNVPSTMPHLRANVLAAKRRLAEGHEQFHQRHRAGCTGAELGEAVSRLRDEVVVELLSAALSDLGMEGPGGLDGAGGPAADIALVAHGGYGRCDVAPYSDVDLMILHKPGAGSRVSRLAERLLRDVFDSGLVLGHSVRTPRQACRLGVQDATICTSLIESRLLAGSRELYTRFIGPFRRRIRWRTAGLMGAIDRARLEERVKYGETVHLLEPNVKRSRGGLRDIQLLRWIGMVRYGTPLPRRLREMEALSEEDYRAIVEAGAFLLRLRNELHFHAGRTADVLHRGEQLRMAELWDYAPSAGMLPVEQFMQDYFRHTGRVSQVVGRFVAKARYDRGLGRVWTNVLGHRVGRDFRVGPSQIRATGHGLRRLEGDLGAVLRLVELANLYNKQIAPDTWQAVARQAPAMSGPPAPEAVARFLPLLDCPGRLAELLSGLHEVGLLETFIPAFAHARGLLQFNQYHKYTVDEHCLRAVEWATGLMGDEGPLGRVYRELRPKRLLHLALLVHDLGKGHPGDHCQVGLEIALDVAARLGLAGHDAEVLAFLVEKHLTMNHLAFRRDTDDERVIVRFAVEVGSPEVLEMLYVLTAADMAAVGPDVWTSWKAEVLTDLYHRAMQHLAGDSPSTSIGRQLELRRETIRARLSGQADQRWFARQVEALPATYLAATEPEQIAADLCLLHGLGPREVSVRADYQPETETVLLTVGTHEGLTPGIFHKLTGAITSQGMEILSAQINTLEDGLVLDRFWARDPDYAGQPPAERLDQARAALQRSLLAPAPGGPSFRRTWPLGGRRPASVPAAQTRVRADNRTSQSSTILDIFAVDRPGLLYCVARTIFELGLSVWRAKIGTFLDQVVDVFYVTDTEGRKIEDEARLEEIRRRVTAAIEELEGP